MFWLHADRGRRAHRPAPSRGIDGRHIFKSANELADETGLTPSQCRRAIIALRRRGLIATRRRRFRGTPTNAVWFTPAGLNTIRDHEGDRRAVSVLPDIVRALRNTNAALLLSQILYWHTRRDDEGNTITHGAIPRLGVTTPWIAKTDAQLAEEIGMSRPQIKRARALLVKASWLRTTRHRFGEGIATFYELGKAVADTLGSTEPPPPDDAA